MQGEDVAVEAQGNLGRLFDKPGSLGHVKKDDRQCANRHDLSRPLLLPPDQTPLARTGCQISIPPRHNAGLAHPPPPALTAVILGQAGQPTGWWDVGSSCPANPRLCVIASRSTPPTRQVPNPRAAAKR